jgi:VWFA-related protein
LVRTTTDGTTTAPTGTTAPPRGLIRTPGRVPDDARTFILAIDEPSFLANQIKPAARAAQAFIRRLDPQDMIGVYVYPYAKPALDMTHDHQMVADKLDKVMGRRDLQSGMFNLSASEIVDISGGDKEVQHTAALHQCPPPPSKFFEPCKKQVEAEALSIGAVYEYEGARRVLSISELIYSLGVLPGHKTLVVLSAGMMMSTKIGGRPDFRSYMTRLGEQAARANVMLYLIHMDNSFEESISVVRSGGSRPDLRFRNSLADAGVWANGLERLAGETGGVYLQWKAGTGEFVFDRVLRETTAYYLLGVEPTQKDWDGRTLLVNVKSTVKGATVRALRQVIAR